MHYLPELLAHDLAAAPTDELRRVNEEFRRRVGEEAKSCLQPLIEWYEAQHLFYDLRRSCVPLQVVMGGKVVIGGDNEDAIEALLRARENDNGA